MGYGKGMHLKIVKREPLPSAEFAKRREFSQSVVGRPVSSSIRIQRDPCLAGEDPGTADMVIVLVGDQDRSYRFQLTPDKLQPPPDFHPGKAGIDKDGRPAGLNQGTVSPAAASQYAYFHDGCSTTGLR
jgi:hypothetical protein